MNKPRLDPVSVVAWIGVLVFVAFVWGLALWAVFG